MLRLILLTYISVIFISSVCFADFRNPYAPMPFFISSSSSYVTSYPTIDGPTETTDSYKKSGKENSKLKKYDTAVKKLQNLIQMKHTAINFIETNSTNLLKEISRGEGASLDTLADLLQCDKNNFILFLKKNYALIVSRECRLNETQLHNRCFVKKEKSIEPRYYREQMTSLQDNLSGITNLQQAFEYVRAKDIFLQTATNPDANDFMFNILTLNNLSQKKFYSHSSRQLQNSVVPICKFYFSTEDEYMYRYLPQSCRKDNSTTDCNKNLKQHELDIVDYIEKQYPKED